MFELHTLQFLATLSNEAVFLFFVSTSCSILLRSFPVESSNDRSESLCCVDCGDALVRSSPCSGLRES